MFNTWSSLIGVVAGLSAYSSLTNYKIKNEGRGYKEYCWQALLLGIVGHFFVLAVIMVLRDRISVLLDLQETYLPFLVVNSLTQFCLTFINTYLTIENMPFQNMLVALCSTLLSFGLSVFLSSLPFFGNMLFFAFVSGQMIVNSLVSACVIGHFFIHGRGRLDFDAIKYCLRISGPLVFHSISGIILGGSDRVMLQRMISSSVAGTYSFTYSFAAILSGIWSAINAIWTPFFLNYLRQDDIENMIRKKENFDFLFIALFSGFVLIYPEVFRLLADQRYWSQIMLVPFIACAFLANHLYSFPANYEMYKERTGFVALGSMGAAFLNVFLNYFLIPYKSYWGAAIATVAAYVVLFFFHLHIATKVIGGYPLDTLMNCKLIIMLFIALTTAVCGFSFWIVRWIAAAIVGILLLSRIIVNKEII